LTVRLKKFVSSSSVNCINILCEPFSYESNLGRFSLVAIKFEIFWSQNIGEEAAHKMLMKLTTGVDFINVLLTAFTLKDHKSAKRSPVKLSVFLALLGSAHVKATRNMLMK